LSYGMTCHMGKEKVLLIVKNHNNAVGGIKNCLKMRHMKFDKPLERRKKSSHEVAAINLSMFG